MGPVALFDKSFLQMLSTDEAVWFDHFFLGVVAPIFFVETLADLEKPARAGKTPEEEVAIIATKTPEVSGVPCHFHHELCINDLLGNRVPMNSQVPVAGARHVRRAGQSGAVLEETPESKAFRRWKSGHFQELERFHARAWRSVLASVDLSGLQAAMRALGVSPQTCKSLEQAKAFADQGVRAVTRSTGRFAATLHALQVPPDVRHTITERWKRAKKPELTEFAPYAAHLLAVDLFFRIAIGANLLGTSRASHTADLAYLYYLPFCQAFVSEDHLHRRCAPLFLRKDQVFVRASDLKASLKAINELFLAQPGALQQGIHRFAQTLPYGPSGAAYDLCERYAPGRLPGAKREADLTDAPPEKTEALRRRVIEWAKAPDAGRPSSMREDELASFVVKRIVHGKRGSWFQIDPSIPSNDDEEST